jgi:hypothetical protein
MSVNLRRVAPQEVKALSLDPIDDKTRAQAAAIVKDVKEGGEAKFLEIATKFGDIKEGTFRLYALIQTQKWWRSCGDFEYCVIHKSRALF